MDAADSAGFSVRTAYLWRKEDPTFAADWFEAYEQGADALEAEALRRAVAGTEEPVFYLGHQVSTVRKYSDTLLIFLMKSRRPERYCDRIRAARIARDWELADREAADEPMDAALERLGKVLASIASHKTSAALDGAQSSAAADNC